MMKALLNLLFNFFWLSIGFYFKPTIVIFGVVVHWVFVCMGIVVLLIVLLILVKKLGTFLWKKFIQELKKELNIV